MRKPGRCMKTEEISVLPYSKEEKNPPRTDASVSQSSDLEQF